MVYAEYQLLQALHHVETENAANKATALATDISHAMNSNAIAVGGIVLDVLLLAIASVVARRAPRDDAPVATVRLTLSISWLRRRVSKVY